MKISDQTVIDQGPPIPELGAVEESYVVTRDGAEPKTHVEFDDEQALAHLLLNEQVFIGGDKALYVLCNDVFAWGCADGEDLDLSKIEEVYKYWRQDPAWGTTIWCLIQRKELPQRPVERRIREGGVWDLDKLAVEHGLRANHYDGVSHVLAKHKYETYCDWMRENGSEPRPWDAQWWSGWKDYTDAHPKWHSDAWKAEDDRLINEWREANGFEKRLTK